MRLRSTLPLLLAALLLTACSSAPVPDIAYYRMPPPAQPASTSDTVRFARPIVVEPFRASGVYNDQAILYALKPDGSIKAYHYQLWDDSPNLMLQRRLIAILRANDASNMVADRLPATVAALRIGGTVEQFERVQDGTGWTARVRLELRVDRDAQSSPALLKTYSAEVAATNDTINAGVRAFAQALDQCFAEFWTDIEALPTQ